MPERSCAAFFEEAPNDGGVPMSDIRLDDLSVELIKAFVVIPSPPTRRAFVKLVSGLADAEPDGRR